MRERIVKKGPTQRRQGAVSTSFIMVGSETQLSIARTRPLIQVQMDLWPESFWVVGHSSMAIRVKPVLVTRPP